MDTALLSLVLAGVVFGCCFVLCLVVVFLFVKVRRMRLEIDNYLNNGIYTDPDKERGNGGKKLQQQTLPERYAADPSGIKNNNRGSAVHADPDETVTFVPDLTRPGIPDFNNAGNNSVKDISNRTNKTGEMAMQFINKGFRADSASAETSSRETNQPQHTQESCPIYTNESEPDQPVYQNYEELKDEPIYLNKGELSKVHNPENSIDDHTLPISRIS